MREILFRAFVKDKEKIFDVKTIDFSYKFITFEEENKPTDTMRMLDQIELMQYTGLTDKNGTKIFEGDIVNIVYEEYPIENCVVVFGDYEVFRDDWGYKQSTCGFALKFDDGSGYTNLTRKNVYEVIGNIYDNPELLGGDNA